MTSDIFWVFLNYLPQAWPTYPIIIVFYFSPAKDCVSIPGIDDISPEEMRHEALSAKTAGTSAQYQQNLQGLIQGYQNKRQALLNPSQDLKEVLRKIYSKEPLQNIPPNLFQIGQNQGKYLNTNMLNKKGKENMYCV